jgi:dolichol-phosphate mannosyltransferase
MVPQVAIIVPVLNEADNIEPFVEELSRALTNYDWELIFVDDASNDGTQEAIWRLAAAKSNVRLLRRFGRHGLASACIEGMCSTCAPFLAVMDADLQHDPTLLPRMISILESKRYNLVIGSRYMQGGDTGEWSKRRKGYSRAATLASQVVLGGKEITDPMSGYFMADRGFFLTNVPLLCGKGFEKLLLDMLSTARNGVQPVEIPYCFRARLRGTSKLRASVVLEFLILLLDMTLGRLIPYRFLLFIMMGSAGAVFHLLILGLLLYRIGAGFAVAQGIASSVAIVVNFALNNMFTHPNRKLAGIGFLKGLSMFMLVCAFGAFANVQVANYLFEQGIAWWLCGLLGALIGAVWNYAVSSTLVWKPK